MKYYILDDLTQSVLEGPFPSREAAEKRLPYWQDREPAPFIAEIRSEESSPSSTTPSAALRERWRNIAGGHWVAAYNALKRSDYSVMRREASAAKDAAKLADPLVSGVFGGVPDPGRSPETIRYEDAGRRYKAEIPRLAEAVMQEIRRHEAWRTEMRLWEREARRTGKDPHQLFREFHALADSLPHPGTKLTLELRRCPRGDSQDHEGNIGQAKVLVTVPFELRLEPGQRRKALVEMTERKSPATGHHRIAWFLDWQE
jgi:hypothetical protein